MSISSPPPIPATVSKFVARRWPGADCRVEPLAGDASTRVYFRIISGQRSYVLALHDAPFDASAFPFIETTGLLQAAGVPVPEILTVEAADAVILLEDLGDRVLQTTLETLPPREEVERLYLQAVDLVARLQRRGTPRLSERLHAGRAALDAERFRFELDFFFEHLVRGLRGQKPDARAIQAVDAAFSGLCSLLDAEPRVLCHRDYHSRNLMVGSSGDLTVVDHQDARRGPDTYDLASLLRDPYVELPEDLVEKLIDHFHAAAGVSEPRDAFRQRLDGMAVQRTLKAAGTFAAQKMLHGRTTYLRFLPRALDLARQSLIARPDLEPLRAALAPWVPELR